MVMSNEYLEQVIDEIYDVCTMGLDWPRGFTVEKRTSLLQSLIDYYQKLDTRDGYIKCAKLRDIIKMIELFNKQGIRKETKSSGSTDLFRN
jgi:hypothetical protein